MQQTATGPTGVTVPVGAACAVTEQLPGVTV